MTIIELISEKNVTLYRINKDTGIPYTTLSDLANGKTSLDNISLRTFRALSHYMGYTMDELYSLIMSEPPALTNPYKALPVELNESINELVDAINRKQKLIDCELSQVLGDINMSESWGLIDSQLAKELREKYVYEILEGLENGQIL